MFGEILELKYSEAREKYPEFESISPAKKVITMKNGNNLDTYSNASDIIVYYDILEDSQPLFFIERLSKDILNVFERFYLKHCFKHFVKTKCSEVRGYNIGLTVSDDGKYYDIMITKNTVWDRISEA